MDLGRQYAYTGVRLSPVDVACAFGTVVIWVAVTAVIGIHKYRSFLYQEVVGLSIMGGLRIL